MKVEIRDGLEFEVNENAVGDWRVVELINDIEDGKVWKTVSLAKMILSPESYEKVKTINTDKNGHMDANNVEQMVTDIMLAVETTKK